jgi:crotonobetainyl-CoA:carnitine CoA-transferase CaiB-like acyl-CoA transferase
MPVAAMHPGADTEAVLAGWGFDADEVARLGDAGVVV